MSSFTQEEFVEYIKGLDFFELDDLVEFVFEYWKAYVENPDDYESTYRYNACMAIYGHLFLFYTRDVIKLRKKYDEHREALEQSD
jgi:hypothetical protein